MKVLVTGSNGFIGSSLCRYLKAKQIETVGFDICDPVTRLPSLLKECDFAFHFAGVNRSSNDKDFVDANVCLTRDLIDAIKESERKIGFYYPSSIRVDRGDIFAKTKLQAEEIIKNADKVGVISAHIDRICNVFGPGCRPNYNSVVATWCYNVSHGIQCRIDDQETVIKLVYVYDLCEYLYQMLNGKVVALQTNEINLGDLYQKINDFSNNIVLSDDFSKKLYATYLSYVENEHSSFLIHSDNRGRFSELIKSREFGQVSLNVIKPGETKGGHYHFRKTERFFIIKGEVLAKLDGLNGPKDARLTVGDYIDIAPLVKHSFINVGQDDAYMIIYCDEAYSPDDTDTYR